MLNFIELGSSIAMMFHLVFIEIMTSYIRLDLYLARYDAVNERSTSTFICIYFSDVNNSAMHSAE